MKEVIKKRNKKIVFISVAIHFTTYQYEIGKRLAKEGYDIVYVTYSKECEQYLKKRNVVVYYMPYFFVLLKLSNITNPTNDKVKYIENHGLDIDKIIKGDADISKKSKNEAIEIMYDNVMFWEYFLDEEKPDMIIGTPERYVGMIPYYLCKGTETTYYYWKGGCLYLNQK